MGLRHCHCHKYSPGRRLVRWLGELIMWVTPRNLLTPSETVLLGIGSLIFVVLFVSVLLPVYLGKDVQGAGYVGSVIPIIYLVFMCHYVLIRCYHRMASSKQFDAAMFDFERWSRHAESAWIKVGLAFRNAKMKERILGEPITQADVSDKIDALMVTDEVTDLPVKLQQSVKDAPRTYYEQKLLKFLFPETRDQRKQRNRKKIVFLSIVRIWVWRSSIITAVLLFVCFLVPLTVFIPVSYKDGKAPSSSINNGSLVLMRRQLQDEPSSIQMYYSSYYAIYFFSVFFPAVYLILFAIDFMWVLLQLVSTLLSWLRSKFRRKPTGTSGNAAISATTPAKVFRLKKGIRDPRKKNLDLAESDLNDAFESIHERSSFTWGSSQTLNKKSSFALAPVQSRPGGLQEDRNVPLDILFRAFENFQSDVTTPGVRVIRIRAAALAGRVFCLRRDMILDWKHQNESAEEGLETMEDDGEDDEYSKWGSRGSPTMSFSPVVMGTDPMMADLQFLESALTRAMSTYTEVAKMYTVQHALLLIRVMKRLKMRSIRAAYHLRSNERHGRLGSNVDVKHVTEILNDMEKLLLGLEKRDVEQNEIQFTQEMCDLEERFESALIELQTTKFEEHTKEAQFLCWIGLARIYATTRGLSEGESVASHLKRLLNEEILRKNQVAKRLSENPHVRKCLFWMAFTRLTRKVSKLRKSMEIEAVRQQQLQEEGAEYEQQKEDESDHNDEATEETGDGSIDLVSSRKEFEQLRKALETEILELVFGQPDPFQPTAKHPLHTAQLSNYLRQGFVLPVDSVFGTLSEVGDGNGESQQEQQSYVYGSASSSRDGSAGSNVLLLDQEELVLMENAVAQAYAGEAFAQLLGLESLGPKRRMESMDTVRQTMKRMEVFFSPRVLKQERIRYVLGLARLEEQLSAVNLEWQELTKGQARGVHRITAQSLHHRENCFRLGVSFNPEVPISTSSGRRQLDDLKARSYAGLVFMNVAQGKLEEAEGWTDRLRIKLPAHCLDASSVEQALQVYRKARLENELGRIMFRVYQLFTLWEGRLMLHVLLFWVFFVLPLILGLNFVFNHQDIPDNALRYDWFADSVFWLQFFGVIMPAYSVLCVSLRWTFSKRLLWFGEKEAGEELHQDVANTLIAAQVVKVQEKKRNQEESEGGGAGGDSSTSTSNTIAPMFGGEYPYWAMGECLITAPGKKTVLRHGHRLHVTRMALVLFFFALCPLVALPPTMVILISNNSLDRSSAYWYAMLVITVTFPVVTMLFFSYKLLVDALPGPVKHARNYFLVYLVLCLIFPIILGVPLLAADVYSSPVQQACLFTWIICSCLGTIWSLLRDIVKNREAMRMWIKRLTWERDPVYKVGRFAFFLAVLFVPLAPVAALGLLLADVFVPQVLLGVTQSSLSFTVAALEVVACLACVIACTSGVKLGWIHPKMTASSLVPFSFVALGGMIATTMAVKVVRRNGNTMNVVLDSSAMRPMAEASLWGVSIQICLLIVYLVQFKRKWEQREMFGYFPDEWELVAPTARFVVEEARDIPFESDKCLKRDLMEHGVEVPMVESASRRVRIGTTTTTAKLDRAKAEQALEEQIRREKEEAELFEMKQRQRRLMYEKHVRQGLAETVFSEIMRGEGAISVAGSSKSKQRGSVAVTATTRTTVSDDRILKRYRISKKSLSLSTVLGLSSSSASVPITINHKTKKMDALHLVRFRPTHLLDVLEPEFHVVNILFKVIRAYKLNEIHEFRWITADNVVANFPQCRHSEVLVTLLEIRFRFQLLSSDRVRLLVFETSEQRDEFIRILWKRTLGDGHNPNSQSKWVYHGEGVVDSLQQMDDAVPIESANV